jgi:hypothetical protein
VIGEPVKDVDDGPFVLGDGGIEAQAVDRVGRRGEGPDQVGEADLDPGPLEEGEYQAQVGKPPPVELPLAANTDRCVASSVSSRRSSRTWCAVAISEYPSNSAKSLAIRSAQRSTEASAPALGRAAVMRSFVSTSRTAY